MYLGEWRRVRRCQKIMEKNKFSGNFTASFHIKFKLVLDIAAVRFPLMTLKINRKHLSAFTRYSRLQQRLSRSRDWAGWVEREPSECWCHWAMRFILKICFTWIEISDTLTMEKSSFDVPVQYETKKIVKWNFRRRLSHADEVLQTKWIALNQFICGKM